jgi:putative ABC transport system permease protein
MFRNFLAAAWRRARRDRLHTILNLAGLSLGFATAILIGLYVRDELSFDQFIPDHDNIYYVRPTFFDTGRPSQTGDSTPQTLAAELRVNFPEILAISREAVDLFGVSHGDVEANEKILDVDPSFFDIFTYKLLLGDRETALKRPDSVVLSETLARKYFGTIDCLGQTLLLDRAYNVTVTGVLADPPSSSFHRIKMLLSGNSRFSQMARLDQMPHTPRGEIGTNVDTFVRLRPGTDPATLQPRLDQLVRDNYGPEDSSTEPMRLWLRRLTELHLSPHNPDMPQSTIQQTTLLALIITGMLILVVAATNFVNLVAARSTRSAVEVGVRKSVGATTSQLLLQFMGEAVGFALASMVVAMALVELLLPRFDAFLDRSLRFDYAREPAMLVALILLALLVGLAAGLYPALVMCRFRPAIVLKGKSAGPPGSGRLRQTLVLLQFSVSIGLLIATGIVYRQTDFATHASLRFKTDQIVTIDLGSMPLLPQGELHDPAILRTLKTRLAGLPGIKEVAGSDTVPNVNHASASGFQLTNDPTRKLGLNIVSLDEGFFAVYGMHPLAGRDLDLAHSDDRLERLAESGNGTALINETAAHQLGFKSPQDAIGQTIKQEEDDKPGQIRTIVGVMPDMQIGTAREPVSPTLFLLNPIWDTVLSVKLTGAQIPETLAAIDRIWRELVPAQAIERQFLDDRIAELYRDLARQMTIFGIFALVAVAIACFGLFGLAAFTAERRTKEIGIRKALGASTGDMLRLLVWQFVRPVLLANLIAWPITGFVMQRWLHGFVYRIGLDPLIFLAAGLGALGVAIAVTVLHTLNVARARPVSALRYE